MSSLVILAALVFEISRGEAHRHTANGGEYPILRRLLAIVGHHAISALIFTSHSLVVRVERSIRCACVWK